MSSQQDFDNCWHKVKLYLEKNWAERKFLRVSTGIYKVLKDNKIVRKL